MSEWQRTTIEVDGPRVRADVRDALQRYAAAHGLEAALNASPLAAVETSRRASRAASASASSRRTTCSG